MTRRRPGASGAAPGYAPRPASGPASGPVRAPGGRPEQLDLIDWLAEQQRLEAEGVSGTEAGRDAEGASDVAALTDGTAALLLRREDPARNLRRFYRLSVARSLWGEWGVVRQWGRAGTQGHLRTDWHGACEDAAAERDRIEGAKRKRGYR